MAVYEVTLAQTFAGVVTINRWNYVSAGTPTIATGSFLLAGAFGWTSTTTLGSGTVLGQLQQTQANAVLFNNLVVKNLYSVSDFYEVPFAPNTRGVLNKEALPPFAGYGFRTNRVRSDVSRGTKRFVGAIEDRQEAGYINTTGLTELGVLAALMSDTLTVADGSTSITFTPAVCGKEKYLTEKGTTAYRYYLTEAEQLAHTAENVIWQEYNTIRSQTSRQFGRGQ